MLQGFQNSSRAAATAAALFLTACSTADYSGPVGDFAAATKSAETALTQLSQQVAADYNEVLDGKIADSAALVTFADGDCLATSARCQLQVKDRTGAEQPYPANPPLVNMALVMAQISAYVANLQSLLAADTAQQVETHVNAALGSVENLAQTVANAKQTGTAAALPDFATPVGEAVNWLVGLYVERVKYKGLRHATGTAKPVVRAATDLFSTGATLASDTVKITLAEEVSAANDAYQSDPASTAKADALAKTAAKYDAFLTTDPAGVFRKLGDAHDELADSLASKDVSFASATARIEAFAAEAERLAKVLEDLKAIGAGN